jgi:outer membrane immunogenic protein
MSLVNTNTASARLIVAALPFLSGLCAGTAIAADTTIPAYRIDGPIPAWQNDPNQNPPVQYPPERTTKYDWTGPYFGIVAGGEIGNSVWDHGATAIPSTDVSLSGAAVGATVGYNLQFGNWLGGVDADIDWMNARGSSACPPLGLCETRSSWIGTTRGRVGYAIDRFLPYVTAGAAFGQVFADTTRPPISASSTKFGFTAGAGLEYAIHGTWTAKIEYLYVNLSKLDCPQCSPAGPFSADLNMHLFRLGLNYRY